MLFFFLLVGNSPAAPVRARPTAPPRFLLSTRMLPELSDTHHWPSHRRWGEANRTARRLLLLLLKLTLTVSALRLRLYRAALRVTHLVEIGFFVHSRSESSSSSSSTPGSSTNAFQSHTSSLATATRATAASRGGTGGTSVVFAALAALAVGHALTVANDTGASTRLDLFAAEEPSVGHAPTLTAGTGTGRSSSSRARDLAGTDKVVWPVASNSSSVALAGRLRGTWFCRFAPSSTAAVTRSETRSSSSSSSTL